MRAAVLFDFDGTLTEHGALDFALIRREIGCPPEEGILRYLERLPEERRREAERILTEHETRGAAASVPRDGAEECVRGFQKLGLGLAVLTRNTRGSVERSLENFTALGEDDFDFIITRDDALPQKPSPHGVLEAARRWQLEPARLLFVGDYVDDITAGRAAGVTTVLFDGSARYPQDAAPPDYAVAGFASLRRIVYSALLSPRP